MKKYFIPSDDTGKDEWLSNFSLKINTYATKYGITAAEVTDMKDSYTWFHYWLDYKNKFEEYTKKLTSFKNQIRNGIPAGATAAILPTPPAVTAPPTAVLPDVFGRAASLAARIKGFQSFTDADGHDLGIIGEDNSTNFATLKPLISVRLIAGGHPEIVWNKQGMTSLEIYVDRNTGTGYTFLAIDSIPNYTDNTALPVAGQSQVWKYKAIYRYHDEQAGLWSDEISTTVTGNI